MKPLHYEIIFTRWNGMTCSCCREDYQTEEEIDVDSIEDLKSYIEKYILEDAVKCALDFDEILCLWRITQRVSYNAYITIDLDDEFPGWHDTLQEKAKKLRHKHETINQIEKLDRSIQVARIELAENAIQQRINRLVDKQKKLQEELGKLDLVV